MAGPPWACEFLIGGAAQNNYIFSYLGGPIVGHRRLFGFKKIDGHVRLGVAAKAEAGLHHLHVAQSHKQVDAVYVATALRRPQAHR